MKALLSFLLLALCIYGAFVWAAWKYQHRLVYFPDNTLYASPQQIGLPFEDVYFQTEDGINLHGWHVSARKDSYKGMLLFFHGNAGNISHRLESIRLFNQLGLDVFIFDYRGYGQSEGAVSEIGTYKDADAAWRYLTEEKDIPQEEIILFGRSLGGGVASELATKVKAKGLILESTFTSIVDVGAKAYPLLPVRWLSRIRYSTKNRMASIDLPLLVIHSRDDDLIPFEHGEMLHQLAGDNARLVPISGNHNDGFMLSGRVYTKALYQFISELP